MQLNFRSTLAFYYLFFRRKVNQNWQQNLWIFLFDLMYQRTLHRKPVHRRVRKTPEVPLGRPPGLCDQFGHKTGHWSPFQFYRPQPRTSEKEMHTVQKKTRKITTNLIHIQGYESTSVTVYLGRHLVIYIECWNIYWWVNIIHKGKLDWVQGTSRLSVGREHPSCCSQSSSSTGP